MHLQLCGLGMNLSTCLRAKKNKTCQKANKPTMVEVFADPNGAPHFPPSCRLRQKNKNKNIEAPIVPLKDRPQSLRTSVKNPSNVLKFAIKKIQWQLWKRREKLVNTMNSFYSKCDQFHKSHKWFMNKHFVSPILEIKSF